MAQIVVKFQAEKGYLRKITERGPSTLTVFGKNYLVNSLASFDEPEIGELRNALAELVKKVNHEE